MQSPLRPSLMVLVLSSAATAGSSVYDGVRARARAVGWTTCVYSDADSSVMPPGPPGVNVLIQGHGTVTWDQAAPSHNSQANGQKAPVIKKYNSVITYVYFGIEHTLLACRSSTIHVDICRNLHHFSEH